MKQIIRKARFVTGKPKDIVIENGKFMAIVDEYAGEGEEVSFEEDVYMSSGWIDLHTHAFPGFPPYCAEPDEIGYKTGVTTVVDAGTCGSDQIDSFYRLATKSMTRIFAFLNISSVGLSRMDELSDLSFISAPAIEHALESYPSFIVGLKARMSASVVGTNDIQPLLLAKAVQQQKPLMVHIGSAPPNIDSILNELKQGDIITHCYNGKANNLFREDGKPLLSLQEARERGVALDVGHGTESFSFEVAEQALKEHVHFDTISTDIYERNQRHGPVYDMASTLTKCLALGCSLETVIQAVTEAPARLIGRTDIGTIKVGANADLTLFKLEHGRSYSWIDSHGAVRQTTYRIKPLAVYIGGTYIEL
ncbi:amidohydrolase/deacetylase family metallohydrolase [Shouchella lehensis]|uniref:Dihydroorotase n=1 Tax=Shouchella lehensis G1 TaxID=1246626 RepID=A0A060LXB9_9BACI|nr:amidohydrolase/deacetylase family metallohydrolase [Shouchella lehensis]AIC94415.1 dihydroorotase [Shouchella lehensis G1]RQW20305.1 amidohydrolase/deacetylase family metallohydrolase [Bacillus sp. C1-1]